MPALIALISLIILLSAGAAWAAKAGNRADINQRLQALEQAPAPEAKMGAMCYAMMAPPTRVEYVCPTCGGKSLYAGDHSASWFLSSDLEACRRAVERLKKAAPVEVAWSEIQWCRTCSPGVEKPAVSVTLQYEDGAHTTPIRSSDDLVLMSEFFEGKKAHATSNDGIVPMKNLLPRLRELLGVSATKEQPDG